MHDGALITHGPAGLRISSRRMVKVGVRKSETTGVRVDVATEADVNVRLSLGTRGQSIVPGTSLTRKLRAGVLEIASCGRVTGI